MGPGNTGEVIAAEFSSFDAPFIAMAHRGGSLLPANRGKENTIAAFSQAHALGYRWLETDVHATRDGQLVAFHDPHLDRVSDATGAISELSLAQVREVRVGGEPIPTMGELLEAFPDCRFNVDLKADGTADLLAGLLQRRAAEPRVCVGSFTQRRLDRFRRLTSGRVATSCGPWELGAAIVAPPLVRFSRGVALQVPVTTPIAGHQVAVVTPELVTAAHRAGRVVQVWTIDDRAEMNRLIDLGVDGLITDAIDVLKQVLVGRGLWTEPTAQIR